MNIQESQRAGESEKTSSPSRGPLRVVCFSTYVADPVSRTTRHCDVRNFLLALRGEKIEGESTVPVGDDVRRLTSANANDSIDWFGEMVFAYLDSNRLFPPFVLLPVPTSKATLHSSAGPWTSLLAISIVSNGLEDAEILDALRWRKEVPPPSQRTASVAELYDNLAVTRRLDPDVARRARRLPVLFECHTKSLCRHPRSTGSESIARALCRADGHPSGPRSLHRCRGRSVGVPAGTLINARSALPSMPRGLTPTASPFAFRLRAR